MPTLPPAMLQLLAPFAPLFARRVWCHALVLVVGTLLAPGKRTVCAALRAMGLSQTKQWTRYHRVLNRAKWSSLAVSRRDRSPVDQVHLRRLTGLQVGVAGTHSGDRQLRGDRLIERDLAV